MNDPQPEGHMASYIERRKFLATLGGAAVAWPLATGWLDGRNLRIEYRWVSDGDLLRRNAAELASMRMAQRLACL
jgi:hypothetical protein